MATARGDVAGASVHAMASPGLDRIRCTRSVSDRSGKPAAAAGGEDLERRARPERSEGHARLHNECGYRVPCDCTATRFPSAPTRDMVLHGADRSGDRRAHDRFALQEKAQGAMDGAAALPGVRRASRVRPRETRALPAEAAEAGLLRLHDRLLPAGQARADPRRHALRGAEDDPAPSGGRAAPSAAPGPGSTTSPLLS
jgi:hypothetical protein